MEKYALIRKKEGNQGLLLPEYHNMIPCWPIVYSEEKIFSKIIELDPRGEIQYHLFDTPDEAKKARQTKGHCTELIFTVRLNDNNTPNPTTEDEIIGITTALHGEISYVNVLQAWGPYKNIKSEITKLKNIMAGRNDLLLDACITNLCTYSLLATSELPHSELFGILELSRALLQYHLSVKLSSEKDQQWFSNTVNEYKRYATNLKTSASPKAQALGLCMLALAAAILALGWSLIPGLGLGLAGLGLFAVGRYPCHTGLSSAMENFIKNITPLSS